MDRQVTSEHMSPGPPIGASIAHPCNAEVVVWDGGWWNARQRDDLGDRDRGDAVISLSDMYEYYDGLTHADAEAL